MNNLADLHKNVDSVLDNMPATFNTHEFIQAFAQANQHIYIQALNSYIDSTRPFNALHQQIGKMLKQEFGDRLTHIDNQSSADIFGNSSECAVWQKR